MVLCFLLICAVGKRGAALLAAAGGKQYVKDNKSIPIKGVTYSSSQPMMHGLGIQNSKNHLKEPLMLQPLPKKLNALKDAFNAILTVYEMLRRRNKRPTFSNLRPAVEEVSGRRFTEDHLQQLASLIPEALSIEVSQGPSRIRRHKGLKSMYSDPIVIFNGSTPELTPTLMRNMVHERLAKHLLHSYKIFLMSEADKKKQEGSFDIYDELNKEAESLCAPIMEFRSPYPDAVPDFGEQQSNPSNSSGSFYSSPRPVTSCNISIGASAGSNEGAVSISGLGTGSCCSATIAPLTEAELQHPGPRRLSFAPSIDIIAELAREEAATKTDFEILSTVPDELRRRSLDGIVSLEALRALEGNEVIHRRLSTHEAQEERESCAVIALLPQMFTRVRRIFGSRGPTAMKFDELVVRILEGATEKISETRAKECLKALAEHAPEFMELKPWGSCGTPAVWINRRCQVNAISTKLRKIAEERPKLI